MTERGRIEALASDATHSEQALTALGALTDLRRELDELEPELVARALGSGASWSRIAGALGVTKQAAHRKHRAVKPADERADPRGSAPGAPEEPAPEREARRPHAGPATRRVSVSQEARDCVRRAVDEARAGGAAAVGSEHLLLGILRNPATHAAQTLLAAGVTLEGTRSSLRATPAAEEPERGTRTRTFALRGLGGRNRLTAAARRILEAALQEAAGDRHGPVVADDLLLALLAEPAGGALHALVELGVEPERLRHALRPQPG